MRCFIGIELDASTRDALVAAGDAVRATDRAWAGEKWVRLENLHVTVAFLGDVDERIVGDLADAIGQRLGDSPAFALPFGELRAVPGAGRASMLWAAYGDPERRGEALERAIAAACEPFGLSLEDRTFKAHVTLVRARRRRRVSADAIAALNNAADHVPRFVSVLSATLFTSTLTKAGPIYRPLSTWTFRASDACR